MPLLFVVEDVFEIKERGVLAIGKLADADSRFRIGELVQVRRRDGSVIRTAITGIPIGMMKIGGAEVFLRGMNKSDILRGDEVWLKNPAEPEVAPDCGGIT